MAKEYDKNAYAQSYVIVNYLLELGEIIVPDKLMNILENKRNKNYKYDINDLNQIELLPDTEKILTEVFLECLVNKEEKKEIENSVANLRKLIINEQIEVQEENNLPLNLATLKLTERFKIAIKKIWNISSARRKMGNKLEKGIERL